MQVPRSEINYIDGLLDSYEGLALMRTIDGKKGIVEFWVPPGFESEFEQFIEDIKKEVEIVRILKKKFDT